MKKNINLHNTKKAILSFCHTPKKVLNDLKNLSNKQLLFHLENFCLICGDDYIQTLKKFNIKV